MSLRDRILTLFRLFLLFTVLVAAALISAITTIRLTIYGRQLNLPNLVGRPIEDAQRLSGTLGLDLRVEDRVYNPRYPANQIISQYPSAGTRVKMGQHVHVLVSLGFRQVTVPNVVGASARAAQINAIQDGLTVGDVVRVYWPGTEPDEIVAQEPPASTTEVHSPALNVLVSMGAPPVTYQCPDFAGRMMPDAQRLLQENGFQMGQAQPIPKEGVPPGTILAQVPPAGVRIDPGTTFIFQVAVAVAPPAVPANPPAATPANPPGASSSPAVPRAGL